MSEYRERKTGEVKTQGEWRAVFKNMSLPKVWNSNVCDAMNIDPVLPSPPATTTASVDGKTTTKADHEKAYQATLDATAAVNNRSTRDSKLAETDWTAMSDVTMADNMKTYRQALRDLPTHKNWPNLEDADWPTKP